MRLKKPALIPFRTKLPQKPFNPQANLGFAYRLGIEFISGIIVGLLLGYAIDHMWETQPWGLVGMILLGATAGLVNILRLLGLWGTLSRGSPSLPLEKDKEEKDG